MIGPGTGVRVYLACGATDMRKGIAGLAVERQPLCPRATTTLAGFVAAEVGLSFSFSG
jgi:transposase